MHTKARLRQALSFGGLSFRELVIRTYRGVIDNEIQTRAAGVAFYAMLALVPFIGLILSNPSLRLIAEAPPWKRLAGQVLLRVAPWVTLQTGIDYDQLTQAPDEIALLDADPLRHHRISPPTYFGMLRHGPLAIAEAGRIAASPPFECPSTTTGRPRRSRPAQPIQASRSSRRSS